MKKLFLSALLIGSCTVALNAENNNTAKMNSNTEHNNSMKANKSTDNNDSAKAKRIKEQIKEQMKREEKYAKEQRFYQGDDYDLKAVEINEKSLDSIPVIEPDYDFEIDDVYRDDI
jgi:Ni/Co efflux regulator RcnB